jgi:putative transcriptional regulator
MWLAGRAPIESRGGAAKYQGMTDMTHPDDLIGKMLIAMPGMDDPRFERSLILICAHSAEGTMGLIVNTPLTDLSLSDMLDQLDIAPGGMLPNVPVCYGGPVETQRGFVLHGPEYDGGGDVLEVDGRFALSATVEVMKDLAAGRGPADALVALGYAGWGPGQLEDEIQANGWLTCEASPALVFGTEMPLKWEAALASLGVHPSVLSAEAGRA